MGVHIKNRVLTKKKMLKCTEFSQIWLEGNYCLGLVYMELHWKCLNWDQDYQFVVKKCLFICYTSYNLKVKRHFIRYDHTSRSTWILPHYTQTRIGEKENMMLIRWKCKACIITCSWAWLTPNCYIWGLFILFTHACLHISQPYLNLYLPNTLKMVFKLYGTAVQWIWLHLMDLIIFQIMVCGWSLIHECSAKKPNI